MMLLNGVSAVLTRCGIWKHMGSFSSLRWVTAATDAEWNCLEVEMTVENKLIFGSIFRDLRTLILRVSWTVLSSTHISVSLSTVKLQKLQLVLEQISSNSAIVGVGPVVFLLSLTAYYVTNELFSSILYLVNIQNWSTLLSCFFSDPVLLRVFWYVFCYSVYYCWTVELLNLHPL